MLVHSPVHRHLGCFHFFTITNNLAVNIYVQVFVWLYVSVPSGICLKVELLHHVVTLHSTFWGIARSFSKQLYCYTFPPAVCEASGFSTSLPTRVHLFDKSHPWVGVMWHLIVIFICISLMTNEWYWASFCVLFGHIDLLWKNVHSILGSF